jgi:hypothetical protein
MAALSFEDFDAFFQALAARVPGRVKIIITGGAAAMLLGSSRPTQDLDFGLALVASSTGIDVAWAGVEAAIAAAAELVRITVQYSADIDRWSLIAMPGYQRHTRPHKRYGLLTVHLLEPTYWAVQKLTRYVDSDIMDLQSVLGEQGVAPLQLARVCGRSLRASPRSTALFTFRQHVEDFFRTYGPGLWGPAFEPELTIRAFHRAAGIGLR